MTTQYTFINKMIDASILAAISAGHEILKIYNDPLTDFSIERKSDKSPLTIADKAAHKTIIYHLQKTKLPILSEEGKHIPFKTRKSWKTFWLVDPLDGTKEFIKRNDEFTVNIALIENNTPIIGVIYVPVTQTIYAGDIKQGAWKNIGISSEITFNKLKTTGYKLPCSSATQTYTIVSSRSHMNQQTELYLDNIKRHSEIDIISKGSSLKICIVAEGAAHEYPRFSPTMEWDTAAGHAIANATGKKLWLTDFSGELTYNKENILNPNFIVK